MTTRTTVLQRTTEERISAIADRYEIELLEVALADNPIDFEILVRLGELYSRVGRYQDGLAIDLRLVALAPLDPIVHYNLACSLSLTGQVDEAMREILTAIRHGYNELDHLLTDPDLAGVRRHASFPEILRRFGEHEGAGRPDSTASAPPAE